MGIHIYQALLSLSIKFCIRFRKVLLRWTVFVRFYIYTLGLQQYTKLESIRDMGSGEPAYRIANRIFARFANFLEPVVIVKIGRFPDKIYLCFNSPWQPLFPVKCMWFPLDARLCFCALGPNKSKNINYWKTHS